jgi:hypothetical protein
VPHLITLYRRKLIFAAVAPVTSSGFLACALFGARISSTSGSSSNSWSSGENRRLLHLGSVIKAVVTAALGTTRVVVVVLLVRIARVPLALPLLDEAFAALVLAVLGHLLECIVGSTVHRCIGFLVGYVLGILDLLSATLVQLLVPRTQLPRALLLLDTSALRRGDVLYFLRQLG